MISYFNRFDIVFDHTLIGRHGETHVNLMRNTCLAQNIASQDREERRVKSKYCATLAAGPWNHHLQAVLADTRDYRPRLLSADLCPLALEAIRENFT